MTHREFYDWQTMGGAHDVTRLVRTLEDREIPWCMIGGLAVKMNTENQQTSQPWPS